MKNIILNAASSKSYKLSSSQRSEWDVNNAVCKKIESILANMGCNVIRIDDITGIQDYSEAYQIESINTISDIAYIVDIRCTDTTQDNSCIYSSNDDNDKVLKHIKSSGLVPKNISLFSPLSNMKKYVLYEIKMADTEENISMYATMVSNTLVDILHLISSDMIDILTINTDREYCVMRSFEDKLSSKFITASLSDAISNCDKYTGYSVYDQYGNLVHESTSTSTKRGDGHYKVRRMSGKIIAVTRSLQIATDTCNSYPGSSIYDEYNEKISQSKNSRVAISLKSNTRAATITNKTGLYLKSKASDYSNNIIKELLPVGTIVSVDSGTMIDEFWLVTVTVNSKVYTGYLPSKHLILN